MRLPGGVRAPARSPRRARAACLLAFVLLTGCGGGGGGGSSDPAPALRVATTALPPAGHQMAYSVALQATGGNAPYAWSQTGGGSLPPGLSVASTGVIAGTATTLGTWTFSVRVTDSDDEQAVAGYSLTVTSFDAVVEDLRFGEAWTGEAYPVTAVGSPSTTFTLVENESGGHLEDASPSTSTATWVAGPAQGTDVLRATSASGDTEDIELVVRTNPAPNMKARFASTDVWYVKFRGRKDAGNPYASDWHEALVRAGLRSPASTSLTGTTADEVADMCVRIHALRRLNEMFGNAAGGGALPGGQDISFPLDAPSSPHVPVGDGLIAAPASNQYNVLSVIAGDDAGVVGTAWLDDSENGSQENNTTTSSTGSLGLFCDELVTYFNVGFSNSTLPSDPIDADDLPALKAILYGTSSPGGRYAELLRVIDGLGSTLGVIATHEIGHSLGLSHSDPAAPGSIMNASTMIGPGVEYAFAAEDWTALLGALPGPGRGGSDLHVQALLVASGDEGGPGFLTASCGCHAQR
jgi:hypothetical protein